MTIENVIQKKGLNFRYEEAEAEGSITPGMLLEIIAAAGINAGTEDTVQVHSTSGGVHERAYAIAQGLEGEEPADAYADEDLVSYHLCMPGDVVYAWLAAGESVSKGDFLMSNGDGTQAAHTGVNIPTGVAMETLDLSASAAVDTRIDLRVV